MITPGLEEREVECGSRYNLVLLAAQRAKQIQEGSPPLVKTSVTHPLSIALEEIRAGVYPLTEAQAPAPKELTEDFIGAALAQQDLTDLASRFTPAGSVGAPEDADES